MASILTYSTIASCYKYDNDAVISWIAFKTPEKVGVGGEFKKFTITPKKNSSALKDLMEGATLSIDTSSVHTKNVARDKKIVSNFFEGVTIKGIVTKLKKATIELDLVINNKKVTVPMKYTLKDNKLSAKATIDVFDFLLHDNLKAINKACYALHEGKTWNDVEIALVANFKPCK